MRGLYIESLKLQKWYLEDGREIYLHSESDIRARPYWYKNIGFCDGSGSCQILATAEAVRE